MSSPFADYPSILRHLESRLLVADLKEILKDLHLSYSGNKRPLIDRVASHLNLLRSANDAQRYTALKNKILRFGTGSASNIPVSRPVQPIRTTFSGTPYHAQGAPPGMPYNQFAGGARGVPYNAPQQILNFKPSPFYEVIERLSNTATLPYSTRNTVSMTFVCSMSALDKLQERSTKFKVAIMCAESTYAYNPNRQLLMEFPNPAEIQVNHRKLQTNLRGMKNKPGTIPPPDITPLIDRTPRLANKVDITYTCGSEVNRKFGAQVVLLQTHSVAELVDRVKSGNKFTKEMVLERLRKPDDDDIELGSFDLTLKDPLSYMRITLPCRSTFCKHNQCWDATAFLQINEQTPQWTCPICHIPISGLSSIAVDGYFLDILERVGEEVDTILVDPQGNWRIPGDEKEANKTAKETPEAASAHEIFALDDTDDEASSEKHPKAVPAQLKREDVSRGSTPQQIGLNKRKPAPICIDLTEDSDEEVILPKRVKQSDSMDNGACLPRFSPKTITNGIPEMPSSAHALPRTDEHTHAAISPLPSIQRTNGDHQLPLVSGLDNRQNQMFLPDSPTYSPTYPPNLSNSELFTRSSHISFPGTSDTAIPTPAENQPVSSVTGMVSGSNAQNGHDRQGDQQEQLPAGSTSAPSEHSRESELWTDDAHEDARLDFYRSGQHLHPQNQISTGDAHEDARLDYLLTQDSRRFHERLPNSSNYKDHSVPAIDNVDEEARRDREEYSPPIVAPGSNSGRSFVPQQPQTFFSDDFSDEYSDGHY